MTVSQVADHLATCPYSRLSEGPTLTCPQCGDPLDLESGQELDPALARHQAVVCPNTLVACSLTSLGCDQDAAGPAGRDGVQQARVRGGGLHQLAGDSTHQGISGCQNVGKQSSRPGQSYQVSGTLGQNHFT